MRYFFSIFVVFFSVAIMAAGPHPEDRLLDAVQDIQSSNFNSAESKLKTLVTDMPDF